MLCAAVAGVVLIAPVAAQNDDDPPRGRAAPVVRQAFASDTLPALHAIRPVPPPAASVRELPRKMLPNRIGAVPVGAGETLVQANAPVGVNGVAALSFDGVGNVNSVLPPDPTGAASANYFVQDVNLSFAIYNRAGTRLYGPANTNTVWTGFSAPCSTSNDGDGVVLYDRAADRFVISQFALPNYPAGPFYQCIAVSQSNDPRQGWHRYAFLISNTKMNDYPKLGVWPDGYYMTVNQFNQRSLSWGGAGVVAFERSKMLAGDGTARMIYFDLYSVDPNLGGMLPSDLDGTAQPPAGAPNVFAQIDDNAWGYTRDQLELWGFHADWTDPIQSRFEILGTFATASFDSNMCGGSRNCIPQPGTTVKVDAIADRLMFRMPYRNFGSWQSLVLNHTVDVNGADRAGIRWYELRNIGGTWGIYQQGTYAPADGNNRWMGSIAMNDRGDIGLAYSVSSSTVSPSLRFTGRLAADPVGTMSQPEASIVDGNGYQSHSSGRWGDYSHLSADPLDGTAFWYTGEYVGSITSAGWKTRISQLTLSGTTPPPTAYVHVGDLDPSSASQRKGWVATVNITVHDAAHASVPNATVSATWTGGYSGGGSCITNASGQCSISSGTMNAKKASATLSVSSVSHASYSYNSTANHDPDGDSDGTSITVKKP